MSLDTYRAAKRDRSAGLAIVFIALLGYGATITTATSAVGWMTGWTAASFLLVGGWVLHTQGRQIETRLNRGGA
jgi:protein-S-isoprenylcysteine O-methyltransferase Ste14